VGLAILSTASLDVLRRAILSGEVGPIRKAPGVGPRTAQKVIIDLQPKLAAQRQAAGLAPTVPDGSQTPPNERAARVEEALRGLGFTPALARSGASAVDWRGEPTPEEALATALRSLGNRGR
jgi:Holliday junction DNA helicase RuvA